MQLSTIQGFVVSKAAYDTKTQYTYEQYKTIKNPLYRGRIREPWLTELDNPLLNEYFEEVLRIGEPYINALLNNDGEFTIIEWANLRVRSPLFKYKLWESKITIGELGDAFVEFTKSRYGKMGRRQVCAYIFKPV